VVWSFRISGFPGHWGNAVPQDVRLARFRRVLLAAQQTRRYQQALESAGLTSPGAINRLGSIEEALQKLPCMDWAEFQGSPADFYNPAAPSPARQRLRYPTNQRIRTAVLGPRLVESASVRVFHPGWIDQIRKFGPEALAGPVAVLMQLAEAARQAGEAIPTVTRAIVAFTGLEHGALTEAGRDALWQIFQVPIFEQYLGADGSLLAWECEAHEGLHTVEDNAIVEQSPNSELILTSLTDHRRPTIRLVTGLAAQIDTGVCECGQSGPRLISAVPFSFPIAEHLH
jgi:hypothetical protein